eukprot:g20284.t1
MWEVRGARCIEQCQSDKDDETAHAPVSGAGDGGSLLFERDTAFENAAREATKGDTRETARLKLKNMLMWELKEEKKKEVKDLRARLESEKDTESANHKQELTAKLNDIETRHNPVGGRGQMRTTSARATACERVWLAGAVAIGFLVIEPCAQPIENVADPSLPLF